MFRDRKSTDGDYDRAPNAAYYRDMAKDGQEALPRPQLTQLMETGDNYGAVDEQYKKILLEEEVKNAGYNFGWIEGVYIRCTLSIFGVIMFLRLNWVMAQAGIAGGLGVIIWSVAVTSITTMSLSAISTNGRVQAGGIYYMVSRTLGADIGLVVGMTLFAAQSLAVAMNLVGFAEAVVMLESEYMVSYAWDRIIFALIGLAAMFCTSFCGAKFEVNAQKVLMVTMVLALFSFFIGVFEERGDDRINATGLSSKTFADNSVARYTEGNSWVTVFGVFFPAATGIAAGSSISGDLADASSAIPKGTFLAILTTTLIYIAMALMLAASFNPEGLANITTQICAIDISLVPALVYAGVFAAGLSSALALLIGAPRILMAIARDDIVSFLAPWKVGYSAKDEPVRGYMLVIVIAFLAILSLDLNSVSPLVTNFYLVQYGFINYAVTSAHFAKAPGWRPSFKYYNPWVALLGTVMCGISMFMVGWITAICTLIVSIGLYQYVVYTKPDVNWGETGAGKLMVQTIMNLNALETKKVHVKNFRPQYLVLTGDLYDRPELIKIMKLLRKSRGVMITGNILLGKNFKEKFEEYQDACNDRLLSEQGIVAFKNVIVAPTFLDGVTNLLQLSGLGKLKPNTIILGFKRSWATASDEAVKEYVEAVRLCFATKHGVGIVRNMNISNRLSTDRSTVDVWWLVEDGGLTLLQAYLLIRHPEFRHNCTLRVFAVVENEGMVFEEQKRLEDLLSKFRIEGEVIVLHNDFTPSQATQDKFRELSHETDLTEKRAVYFMCMSELLHQYSAHAAMVITSIPVPRLAVPIRKYMTYLEMLSDKRPTLMIRGNQQTVLTYHS